jgi:hypothetical protein
MNVGARQGVAAPALSGGRLSKLLALSSDSAKLPEELTGALAAIR